MRRVLRVVAVASALVLAGCGGGSSGSGGSSATPSAAATSSAGSRSASASPSAGATAAATIKIEKFKFGAPLTVRPGATVRVVNDDSQAHTVTDAGGAFDSGNVAGDGGTAAFTAPAKPGTYQLICQYHANMHGILIVSTSAPATAPSASASDDKGGDDKSGGGN
jgi:plastocyanin